MAKNVFNTYVMRVCPLIAFALLVFHATAFIRFTIDDAYITFTFTKNLVEGNGLVFNAGEQVEATSSLLWALLLVPFEAFIEDGSVIGSKILGILCMLGVCIIGARLVSHLIGQQGDASPACTCYWLLLAGASPFVGWSVYGMENGLTALLLLISILLFIKEQDKGSGLASAVPVFLLETVRPEAYTYIIIFMCFRFFFFIGSKNRLPLQWFWLWFAVLVACLACYELFGFLYFGHLFPNTVSAKVGGFSIKQILEGISYIREPSAKLYTYIFIFTLQLFAFQLWISGYKKGRAEKLASYRRALPFMCITACLAGHWAFVVCVGGDWMINARFLSHIIPVLLALLVALAWRTGRSVLPDNSSLPFRVAVWVLCINGLVFYYKANRNLSVAAYDYSQQLQQAEERAIGGLADFLNRTPGGSNSVVACSDIGRMGYSFNGAVLDWWGLADEEIARSGQGEGRVQAETVLRRSPDFFVLYSNKPELAADTMRNGMATFSKRFYHNKDFQARYAPVRSFHFMNDRWHVLFARKNKQPSR